MNHNQLGKSVCSLCAVVSVASFQFLFKYYSLQAMYSTTLNTVQYEYHQYKMAGLNRLS